MRKSFYLVVCLIMSVNALADLKYHPVTFTLRTEKETYYEGEKVTFLLTITNTSKEKAYPVLLPHTQNTGQKLFYFNLYDKAQNNMILRYTEDRMLRMMVHDTGTVKIQYLQPQEQIVLPLYWNDFENYYSYHTQNASHHSFGVPLFAGLYRVHLQYNPRGIALGDSIYRYYDDFDKNLPPAAPKLDMYEHGQMSNFVDLKIRKSAQPVITIERKTYYLKRHREDTSMCYYYLDPKGGEKGNTSNEMHMTNLPVDSFSLPGYEYFYSFLPGQFNEYITRFDNGDIREYRKWRNECPEEIFTIRYDTGRRKEYEAAMIYDGRVFTSTYQPATGKMLRQTEYAANGTNLTITDFVYDKKGELLKKVVTTQQPCITASDGKSYRLAMPLEGKMVK